MPDNDGKVFEILTTSEKLSARKNGPNLTTVSKPLFYAGEKTIISFWGLKEHICSLTVAHKRHGWLGQTRNFRYTGDN